MGTFNHRAIQFCEGADLNSDYSVADNTYFLTKEVEEYGFDFNFSFRGQGDGCGDELTTTRRRGMRPPEDCDRPQNNFTNWEVDVDFDALDPGRTP